MEIKKVLVTGQAGFLHRYQGLFKALYAYFGSLECLEVGNIYEPKTLLNFMQLLYCVTHGVSFFSKKADGFFKNAQAFISCSKQTERKISQLPYTPDLVFHVFGLCCPFWEKSDIPYAMYLDYTMALCARNYQPWAPFNTPKELESWLDCERKAYEQAKYLFTMSNLVKNSLVEDYGIQPEKITVVGGSGNFPEIYQGEKSFGSRQILFNGSDFERKGGNLVLATFNKVKKNIPEAKLVFIGKKLKIREDGIENPGRISSSSEMRNLFLKTDLVLAPGVCDPFPTFLMEAMNYGIPCVVSANDGMPEIVEHGKTGLVIPQPNPDLLASEITNLLKDNSALTAMSQNARHKIKTQLNWEDVAQNITQVLLK